MMGGGRKSHNEKSSRLAMLRLYSQEGSRKGQLSPACHPFPESGEPRLALAFNLGLGLECDRLSIAYRGGAEPSADPGIGGEGPSACAR